MNITDLLNQPKLIVISGAVPFFTMMLSVAAVIVSFIDQSRILLSL